MKIGYFWLRLHPVIGSTCRNLVEISTKLRPGGVEIWSKFRLKFDTTQLKFRHTLVLKFTVELDVLQCKSCKTGVWKFEFKGLKFRRGGSKFGWKFNQKSTHEGRNLVEVSTKLRPAIVEFWLKIQSNFHMCICVLVEISVNLQHTKVQLWLTHQQHIIMCWFILWSVNRFFNLATTRVSCLSCITIVELDTIIFKLTTSETVIVLIVVDTYAW